MRLEIQDYRVDRIQFGGVTEYSDGLLSINRQELLDTISEDARIDEIDIEIVHPGEKTRITNILEISEPRLKPDHQDSYFPGICGPLFQAGHGKTNVLKGCAVLEVGMTPGFFGSIVDMAGVGARFTPFSNTHNVCLLTKPAKNLEKAEYGFALKKAGLETSVYLAGATGGKIPSEVKIYDLNAADTGLTGLPRVGYLLQLHSHGESREPFVYGENFRQYYPTIMHPNEILDGAIVCGHYDISPGLKNMTYALLNHPVIMDLFKGHGKEINFKGVVIAPEPTTMEEIQRTSMMSAGLLKNVLDLDGVIISKEGGGHTDVDMMRNCDECEKAGIKTVLIDNEWLGPEGTGELSLLDMTEKANAMVSVGNMEEVITLPPLEKIVGGHTMPDINHDLAEKGPIPIRSIANAISQLGFTYITSEAR